MHAFVMPSSGRRRHSHFASWFALFAIVILLGGCNSRSADADTLGQIRALGGKIGVDDDDPHQTVVGIDLSRTACSDSHLALLEKLPGLLWVYLDHTAVSDAGLIHLVTQSKLEVVSLIGTGIGDLAIPSLVGIPNLRRVNLSGTQVGDVGMARLAECPKLRIVELKSMRNVSEGAIQALQQQRPSLVILR